MIKDYRNLLESLEGIDILDYDIYLIAFSGGKDSTACILWLLEQGVDKSKIELWHHLVDGQEDHQLGFSKKISKDFMDWKVTKAYCKAFANALGLKIYFSWRIGGYRAEILKEDSKPEDILFETPNGIKRYRVWKAKENTRRKFPQVGKNMKTRYCTNILKTEVANRALFHQDRFLNKKTLFITGERAEESKNRANYQIFEMHKTDRRNGVNIKRHVDAFRPVHQWTTREVWEIIKKWKINCHPCYKVGFGRCSCAGCIYGTPRQFASLKKVNGEQFQKILDLEREIEYPIHCKGSGKNAKPLYLDEFIQNAEPYDMDENQIEVINSEEFNEPIILEEWIPPRGINSELAGPC